MTVTVEKLKSLNGSQYSNFNGAGLLVNGPGCLGNVIVLGTGTGSANFYDGTSAAGGAGAVIFTVPASATVGTIYQANAPFSIGLYAQPGGYRLNAIYNVAND